MAPVVDVRVRVRAQIQVQQYHERAVHDQEDALTCALSSHVKEVREYIRNIKANKSEDGRRCANAMSVWSNVHGEENASESSEEIQDNHSDNADAIFNASAHEQLADEVASNMFQVTVKERGREESPYLIVVSNLLDIGPAPRYASRVRCQEIGIGKTVYTTGYYENQ